MIQRFEYTAELAWKTIKDYLESQNIVFELIAPRNVIKEAVATKFITQGEDWMNLIDARNKMSRTYDFKNFETVIEQIKETYLYNFLMSGNFENKILAMGYGSVQPNVSPSQIENIDFIISNISKLEEYLNLSDPIFNMVLKNNVQIQTLKK